MALRRIAAAIIIIAACLIALVFAADFLVDWLWFSAVGFLNVFLTIFATKAALFLAVFAASAILLWLNGFLAYRLAGRGQLPAVLSPWESGGDLTSAAQLERLSQHLPWRSLIAGGALVLAALIALGEVGDWDLALRFIRQAPYGQSDPLYGKDIGFYLFSLPVYVALKNWMLLTLVLSALAAGAVYWVHGNLTFDKRPWGSPSVIAHASALLGLFFVVKAWSYWLDRYLLLYRDNGVVVGAAYTDIHVELPVLLVLIGLALAAALASWANIWVRAYRLPAAAAVLVFGSSFLLALAFPAVFQRFYVKPNELQLETPYLKRNIALTREAYNLHQIKVKPFPAEQGLTFQSLQDNRATIDNIRLWDWQPLLDTYAQLQEIRTYYKFLNVDVDRYDLGGSYQQVMLSARELAPARLPPNAQTWVNLHLLFTHGNGVVMSPVTRKSREGLPILYLQDIPPVASGGPTLSEPRIYFGQGADSYVIVKASTPEFDYPKGKDNVYATYEGGAGVGLSGTARRSLFAWYFNDPNILLTSYIKSESRILFRRNIRDRVHTIAPFLRLDRDPYAVISGGRLFWIQDAYTTSDWFPYAQPLPRGDANYIRNSVKIIIDAYNGSVDFYLADPADPVVATYRRIFPGLFKPFAAMPEDLQKHVRYPEDLFLIQAQLYRAYHMDTPEVFYNREDQWQFPRRPTGFDGAEMDPYYIIMRLPGETHAEFFLMLPMVPSQRQNMIAWLAARCDQPDYGKLIVYEFPKDKLVYGPFQIEARINQNTEISQLISLWNQLGSRVIRGNLLAIPIENSILYVSPLYLRAETGQLPELKRVIAAYGDRVVMEETLPAALAALFKESAPANLLPNPPAASGPLGPADLQAREALGHYDRAIARLKAGDWGGFGAELDAMRPLLLQLNQHPSDH
ncbi:MAG: UPF0182 family protein [Rhodomicrobium sp.]